MRNYFLWAGQSSLDYDLRIEQYPAPSAPARKVEKLTVPGRSGELVIDSGEYENVIQQYEVHFWGRDLPDKARRVKQWLLQPQGYQRLEDSYSPGFYRRAVFAGPMDIENIANRCGRVTLGFDCMPQHWRKDGDFPLVLTAPGSLYNELMPARPAITVYGTGAGTLTIGTATVELHAIDAYVTLDSETQNAHKGTVNKNATIHAAEFPVLATGSTDISWTGGVDHVEIIPRWWTL